MPLDLQLPYSITFENSVAAAWTKFSAWLESGDRCLPNFDDFEDSIYLKNRERILVYVNRRYLDFYGPSKLPIGQRAEDFLEKALVQVSNATDSMLADGYRSVEIDHVGPAADGSLYQMRTFKRSLAEFDRADLWILGITRSVIKLGAQSDAASRTLADYARLYSQLGKEEAEMCRLYAMGETTKAIADSQRVTPRTIELRRQKVLEMFGFTRPIEIVKVLVRLQANGLIHIDL